MGSLGCEGIPVLAEHIMEQKVYPIHTKDQAWIVVLPCIHGSTFVFESLEFNRVQHD